MARIVKEHEHAVKRKEIIDAAQSLIYTKGYEQMTIQDILDALQISKGAFYHYFDSKGALLEALIELMREEMVKIIEPITTDPDLGALEKLQRFFDTAGRWKTERKEYIYAFLRAWYTDDNAIVRLKVQSSLIKQTAPLLGRIISQGIQEGVMNTRYPAQVGEIAFTLLANLGDAFVEPLLSTESKRVDLQSLESIVATYNDALERVLGAPSGSVQLIDAKTLREWVDLIERSHGYETIPTSGMA